MSEVTIPYRFKVLGNTAANLAADPGIPKERELVVEIDTGRMKLGDGSTGYAMLPYMGWGNVDFTGLADKKLMAWNASGSKFIPVFLDAVDVTYGAGTVDEALDDLFDDIADAVEEAPIDGKQYGRKDGAWTEITGGGGGGGGGALEFVGSAEVTGAAATSLTISGLDLDADGIYIVEVALENTTASTASIAWTYNADTTAGNYRVQFISGNGTVAGARVSNAVVTSILANECTTTRARITKDRKGRAVMGLESTYGPPSGIIHQFFGHYWSTVANVTSITLTSSVASALAVGSNIKIWKLTETAGSSGGMSFVKTVTVAGSASSSIVVDELDLDSDQQYVVEVVFGNALSSSVDVNLTYNADTTDTNYRYQTLISNGSSTGSGRANLSYCGITAAASNNSIATITIKKDFNGKPSANTVSRENSDANIAMRTTQHMWTPAATNVASFTLTTSSANAFAVGSYVKVFKIT